ncbi:MAG: hypothetical protein ACJ797_22715 [Ktedonobacteraceae bacterium]
MQKKQKGIKIQAHGYVNLLVLLCYMCYTLSKLEDVQKDGRHRDSDPDLCRLEDGVVVSSKRVSAYRNVAQVA